MTIDRRRAREAFAGYAARYNAADPKVKLKIDHTYRVAALCDRIAASLGLPPEERDLAWLCGLLHDVGRFEQLRRYGTFNDAESIDHAAMSARVLFEEGRVRDYLGRSFPGRTAAHRRGLAQRLPPAGGVGQPHPDVLPDPAGRRQGGHPAGERGSPHGGDLQCLHRGAAAEPGHAGSTAGVLRPPLRAAQPETLPCRQRRGPCLAGVRVVLSREPARRQRAGLAVEAAGPFLPRTLPPPKPLPPCGPKCTAGWRKNCPERTKSSCRRQLLFVLARPVTAALGSGWLR